RSPGPGGCRAARCLMPRGLETAGPRAPAPAQRGARGGQAAVRCARPAPGTEGRTESLQETVRSPSNDRSTNSRWFLLTVASLRVGPSTRPVDRLCGVMLGVPHHLLQDAAGGRVIETDLPVTSPARRVLSTWLRGDA